MTPSRFIAYSGGIYIFILGIFMSILSMCSLLAYNCHFNDAFTQSSASYMFYLIYFRSHHCDEAVNWSIVAENFTSLEVQPLMPHETEAVSRTFVISIIQLLINLLLIVFSALMLVSTRRAWMLNTRKCSYNTFFAPLCLMFFASSLFDMGTGVFFSMDLFRANSIDGTMTLLEISNRIETRPVIEQIAVEDRALSPNVMLYVSLKGVAGLILNICLLFFITLAGWEVVDGSKRKAVIKFVTESESDEPSKVL